MRPQKLFYFLLAIWVIIDLIQAIFTPIHADEAYYALYGKFLDWGYYDHPPMVGLLAVLSDIFFNGNLSIRFATVILHGATVLLLWKTIANSHKTIRDVLIFFSISASFVMFSIYGFITTPDAPLLFFTALFFFLYKNYIDTPKWSTAIAIGIAVALMLYSKYMAVLVVGFTLLSNIKLLKDKRLWCALMIAVLLFIPHIVWQIQSDFPSLKYHLIKRNSPFNFKYFIEYIPNQLLVFNPICLIITIFLCVKNLKTNDKFLRASIFTTLGFLSFFWVMTIKGHVEPHWTVAATIPMIFVLFYRQSDLKWEKWLNYTIIPIVAVLLLARFIVPFVVSQKIDVLQNKTVFDEIETYSNGDQVIFTGSFQNPSLYWFYTEKLSTSLSSVYGRQTQFDIWQFDKKFQGKPACIVENLTYRKHPKEEPNVISKNGKFSFLKVKNFQSANDIKITINDYSIKNDTLFLDLTLFNPYDIPFDFGNKEMPVSMFVAYFVKNECNAVFCNIPENIIIPANETYCLSTYTKYIPDSPMAICLDNVVCRSLNSKPILLNISDK